MRDRKWMLEKDGKHFGQIELDFIPEAGDQIMTEVGTYTVIHRRSQMKKRVGVGIDEMEYILELG